MSAWGGRRAQAALRKVKARGRRENATCCICLQPIDYTLTEGEQRCSVQHLKSRKLYPHLTWAESNWAPAHLRCNKSAGDGNTTDLGVTY